MPSESEEEEEKGSNLKKYDKGKGQCILGASTNSRVSRKVELVLVLPVGAFSATG